VCSRSRHICCCTRAAATLYFQHHVFVGCCCATIGDNDELDDNVLPLNDDQRQDHVITSSSAGNAIVVVICSTSDDLWLRRRRTGHRPRWRSYLPTTAVRWSSSPSAPAFSSSVPCRSPSLSPPACGPPPKSSVWASSGSAYCWCCPACAGVSGSVCKRSGNGTGRRRWPVTTRLDPVTTGWDRWSERTKTTIKRTGKHLRYSYRRQLNSMGDHTPSIWRFDYMRAEGERENEEK